MYHILSKLTEDQKNKDGHISYTVLKEYRGKKIAKSIFEYITAYKFDFSDDAINNLAK